MTTPFFSIVIPTFNRSELLKFAIESVLRQTFGDFEIIVSDNHSADDTAQVVNGFGNARIRYVRPPHHYFIADNWEFGRRAAAGKLAVVLGDDDALVPTALEQFARASEDHGADFVFCTLAEYYDRSYLGPKRNVLRWPSCSGLVRPIKPIEFLGPLFSFEPQFNLHPTSFVFAKTLADRIEDRCGRFFGTNGVEFFAWPLAAAFATRIVYIDLPLAIAGRTGKSAGTNLFLCNPGKERLHTYFADMDQERNCAPLNNFTMANLMAEGMLMAKRLAPEKFEEFGFNEPAYLRRTLRELRARQSSGVDVSVEMGELMNYLAKYPSLLQEISRNGGGDGLRKRGRDAVRSAVRALRRLRRGPRPTRETTLPSSVPPSFDVSGNDVGFTDILGCADYLTGVISTQRDVTQVGLTDSVHPSPLRAGGIR